MVTNYPEQVVTQPVSVSAVDAPSDGLFARLGKRIQYFLCGLHGHDPMLHYDQTRIYLRCASCGHETPGWELEQSRPRVRFNGKIERAFAMQSQPFDERRIA